MEFRILGPLEVWDGESLVAVTAAKQRTLLALLLLNVGRVVAVDDLVDELWGGRLPSQPRATLHAHVHRLRQVLRRTDRSGAVVLATRPTGYLLRVAPDNLDRHRWQRLVGEGRAALAEGDRNLAVTRFRSALAVWRGRALADVGTSAVRAEARGLDEERWEVLERCLAAELALGRHSAVLPELETLVDTQPYREGLTGKLMLALSRADRHADALAVFARVRDRLVRELGVEPGAELQELHQTILRGELDPPEPRASEPTPRPAAFGTGGAGSATAPTGPVTPIRLRAEVPAQLPLDVYGFAGRTDELARLDAILAAADRQPSAVAVVVLSGTAGVGKTTLAVHWARRIADRFPDGQLYANLRGFDARAGTDPSDALRGFLGALGVPPLRIPAGLDDQAAMYRSVLNGRRVLVLLDNARDTQQVRPALPGAPGCLVLVTSRNWLPGLAASVGAHPLPVDLLPDAAARDLFTSRVNPDRVTAEPDAVDDIVAACAGLPLALSVVAARAAAQPGFPLGVLADELRHAPATLDAIGDGTDSTDVRAVFSWSYQALGASAARLFRLLGLHPGPDLTLPAAASLADLPASRIRPLLAELTRAHLVTEHVPGRYTFHDLLRAYAAELAEAVDPPTVRRTAVHRLLDHYLHTAAAADRLLRPHQKALPLPPLTPGVDPEPITDHRQALTWFTREHAALVAAVDLAARSGFPGHAWQLAWTLTEYFDRQGHWHDWAATQHTAVEAARELSDPVGQARAHRELGRAYAQLGRLTDAERRLGRALELFERIGDRTYQAYTRHSLGAVLDRQDRTREALDHARQVLELVRRGDNLVEQASARSAIGWYQMRLGDHTEAISECRAALAIQQELGDRRGQASTWANLASAHHHLGQHDQADRCYRQALDLYRDLGDRYYLAQLLGQMGDNHQAAEQLDAAQDVWRAALEILHELDHHDAEPLRKKLASQY
ncbi:BTAD domain-containing putative transcriptional regulator [Plantactinospora mayteni]|uniref:SARP family transcriptional regulator n=1 Tax=Plantactinospora mayteni TaxID=566021 RepID=A0ABQ4F397_9ACTN|nr:BTAD domain-containing putative transcriptional regulator [Plantactinospora mayteni]GIH01386.1 SARP family transcriptional regulator [Plantactinospora mayteni]